MPATRRLAAPALLLAFTVVVGGCGADRSDPPRLGLSGNEETRKVDFPRAGVAFLIPKDVELQARPYPGVFRVNAGRPLASGFAYRRKEQIPRRSADVRAARKRLVKEVKRRDPDFKVRSSRVSEVDGAKAIELVGDQTISRGRLRTHSVHVFKGEAEYVFELLAPVPAFERSDEVFFKPMLRSLELSGKVKRPAKKNAGAS